MSSISQHRPTNGPSYWVAVVMFATFGLGPVLGLAQTPDGQGSSFKELNRFGASQTATDVDSTDEDTFAVQLMSSPRMASAPRQDPAQSTADRLKAIREKIKLLKKLNEESGATRQNPKSNASPSPGAAQNDSTSTLRPTEPNNVRSKLPLPDSVTHPETEDSPDDDENALEIPIPQESGTPVVTEPVNSLELANSLFLIGNPTAARKHYQAILKEKLDVEDEIWLKCLIGCCYRLEGEFDKAEKIFREVTSLKQNSYPINYSKWCLQYLDQRRQTKAHFQTIELEIDAILNKVKRND